MGTEGGELVELRIPARPEYLALTRLIVAATATGAPLFPEDRLDDLRLAVSEVCTNAIEAQRRAGRDPSRARDAPDHILVRCRVADDRVEVEVRDHGGGFDPEDLKAHPPVTDPSRLQYERGLGIPLIRILADEVEFESTGDGMRVRMVLNALG